MRLILSSVQLDIILFFMYFLNKNSEDAFFDSTNSFQGTYSYTPSNYLTWNIEPKLEHLKTGWNLLKVNCIEFSCVGKIISLCKNY